MSADLLRRAAALMREDASKVRRPYGRDEKVAVAVAKAMDDVALAWEIADESNDGLVHDLDNDLIAFEDTIDSGWVAVARVYLGSDS